MNYLVRYEIVRPYKPKTCFGCGRVFCARTQMASLTRRENNKNFSYYLCMTCDSITEDLGARGEDICFGELKEQALLKEELEYGLSTEI